MVIGKPADINTSEITDRKLFLRRREFLATVLSGLAAAATASALPLLLAPAAARAGVKFQDVVGTSSSTEEPPTAFEKITAYNNFYEFGTDKEDPARNAVHFKTRPWSIAIEGEVARPGVYDLEDFIKSHRLKERIYRLRCVEAWSMVVPWVGIPLAELIERFEPTGNAKFVEFVTLFDPEQMPGQRTRYLIGPMSRACASTRPCIRSPSSPWVSTRRCFQIRMAHGSGSSCRGNTASRASNRSSSCVLLSTNLLLLGINSRRTNTVSTPTSTPTSITRAGARTRSGASANFSGGIRCCSTAMPSRWRISMRAWISPSASSFIHMRTPPIQIVKALVFGASLMPFLLLPVRLFTDELGINPVETVTHQTGLWSLRFLLLTLAITPLRRLTGWNALIRLRRMLGLYAFFYACLHVLTWLVLDHFFDWVEIAKDIGKRSYITAGFAAFVLLVPLAATSTNRMIKRLGGSRWKRLHSIVYIIGTLAMVHFLWLIKADIREPLIYAIALTALLAFRIPAYGRLLPAKNSRELP